VSDESRKLLRYIVRNVIAHQEAVDIETDATAVDRGPELEADLRRAQREEEQRADDLADAFRDGLLRAGAAWRVGGNAISLDDRKEEDNRQADALIQFLVRADLAASTTRETDRYRYIYTISIDWDALAKVARDAKVDFNDVLGQPG
jgi:hypothetical protein